MKTVTRSRALAGMITVAVASLTMGCAAKQPDYSSAASRVEAAATRAEAAANQASASAQASESAAGRAEAAAQKAMDRFAHGMRK